MGFAEGFAAGSSGIRGAIQLAFDQAAREKAEARLEEQLQWQREDRDRLRSDRLAEDQARNVLQALNTSGKVYDGTAVDWSAQPAGMDAGPLPELAQPRLGLSAPARQAGPLDTNQALQSLALAKRDYAAVGALAKEGNKLQGDAATRAFIADATAKYNARLESPEAAKAYADLMRPHADMFSRFTGLPADYRINAKTMAIEAVPYDGSPPREHSFQDALPYLVASHKLSSQFADPDAALTALETMSDKQRQQLLDRAKAAFEVTTKGADLGLKKRERDTADTVAENTNRHWLALERLQAEHNRVLGGQNRMGAPVQMVDADNNVHFVMPFTKKDGSVGVQRVEMPEGLRMPKLPQVLNDAQKIGLTKFYEATAMLPPTTPQGQIDALAARFGVSHLVGNGGAPGGPKRIGADVYGAELPRPSPSTAAPEAGLRPSLLQQKYDAWQESTPRWYEQARPGQAERAAQLRREYEELLRAGGR